MLWSRTKLLLTSMLILQPPGEYTTLLLHGACLPSVQKTLPCPMQSVASAMLFGPQRSLNLNPSLHVLWSNSQNGLGNILNAEWPAGKSAHRGPKICRFIACKPKSILKKEEIKIDGELGDRKGSQWRLDALLVDSSSLFYCSIVPITAVLFQLLCSEQTFVLHRSFFI